jgi:undecaprenyl diphosphate synthase
MKAEFKSLAFSTLVHLFRIRVCIIGGEKEIKQLPSELRDTIRILEETTREHDNLVLLLAVGYGGRREIVESVERTLKAGKPVNEETIGGETYCARLGFPRVDLIIRTSEKR